MTPKYQRGARNDPPSKLSIRQGAPRTETGGGPIDGRGTGRETFIRPAPSSRPLDLLNHRDEGFIAITEVRLSEPGHAVPELPFLAVSKGQIARMYEAKES